MEIVQIFLGLLLASFKMSREKKGCVLVLLAFICAENLVPATIGRVTQAHWTNDPKFDHHPGKNLTVTIRAATNMFNLCY